MSKHHSVFLRSTTLLAVLAAIVGTSVATTTLAQNYPTRSAKFILGFPPGGGSDALARLTAAGLTEKLGQQFVVDNKPGANTILATEYVKTQPADGYTMLFVSASFTINPSLYKLNYDIEKDFSPVSVVGIQPLLLITHNDVPAKTVKELIALTRAQAGKATYASFGIGSAAHLAGEMIVSMTGVDMLHVPYKGSAPAIADVMGGRITMMLPGIGSAINLAREGKLRAIAVSSLKRAAAAPDIPTIAESGIPGFEVTTWESIHMPAGAPADVVAKMNASVREILQNADLRQKMVNLGFDPEGQRSPAETARFMQTERAKWAKLVKERNIKAE